MKIVRFIGKLMDSERVVSREFETQETESEIEREFVAFVERNNCDIMQSTWIIKAG